MKRGSGALKCRDGKKEFTAYLSGDVDAGTRAELEAHLATCAPCGNELAGLRDAWEHLREWEDEVAPPHLLRSIEARWAVAPVAARGMFHPWVVGLTALAAALLSIGNSLLIPYERAFALCAALLRSLPIFVNLPDPVAFFVAGILYGLLPLLIVAAVAGRLAGNRWTAHGVVAGILFMLLVTPYALIVCSALPAAFTAALIGGMAFGALSGSLGGFSLGRRPLGVAP
jgi:anti-sigma factor RsiW